MLLCASASAESKLDAVDRIWKARGLQAFEKLKTLNTKNGDSKGKKLSQKEHCQWILENTFLGFAIPDLTDVVRKPVGKTIRAYIMAFMDNGILGQVSFFYPTDGNAPVAVKVPQAKLNEFEFLMVLGSTDLIVNTSKCSFTIPSEKPYEATADVR